MFFQQIPLYKWCCVFKRQQPWVVINQLNIHWHFPHPGFILPEQSRLITRACSSLYVIQAFEFGMKSYALRMDCFDLPTPPTAASRQIKAHHHGNALIHWGQRESMFLLRDFRGRCLRAWDAYMLCMLILMEYCHLVSKKNFMLHGLMILKPFPVLFTDMACFCL